MRGRSGWKYTPAAPTSVGQFCEVSSQCFSKPRLFLNHPTLHGLFPLPSLSHLPFPSLQPPGTTFQINHLHSSFCLRVCFQGTQTKTDIHTQTHMPTCTCTYAHLCEKTGHREVCCPVWAAPVINTETELLDCAPHAPHFISASYTRFTYSSQLCHNYTYFTE